MAGTRRHRGLAITRLGELPMVDPQQLSDILIEQSQVLFVHLAERQFLPVNEAYRDPTRIALDDPTVHGGKGPGSGKVRLA